MEIIDNINRLLGDDLKQALRPGSKLKVAASCFSIYAYEALKKELKAREIEGRLTMNLEGDVLFDYGKSELRPEAESALEKVAVVISQFPESNVLIRGYTDAKGPADANLVLSQKRAAAVKRWLVKKGAVTETKIATEGLGEKDPVAENKNADGSDNPQGRQQNRRVEITVEKPPTAK